MSPEVSPIKPSGRQQVGVLLLHGILGTPKEFAPLEMRLRARGILTRALTHPGHGPADPPLCEITYEMMLSHCQAEYQALAAQCDRVYLIGHSMGGMCSMWLSGQRPDKLAGVLAFAAPYQRVYLLNDFQRLFELPGDRLRRGLLYAHEVWTGYPKPLLMPWWMSRLSEQASEMFQELDLALGRIERPLWLAHSPYDFIVPYEEMARIAQRVSRPELVRAITLDQCGHQVFTNWRDYQEPYHLVDRFLEALESGQDPGGRHDETGWQGPRASGDWTH